MRFHFPVDLTGNLIMIEKLVLGDLNWGPPDLQSRRANLCAIKKSVIIQDPTFSNSGVFPATPTEVDPTVLVAQFMTVELMVMSSW